MVFEQNKRVKERKIGKLHKIQDYILVRLSKSKGKKRAAAMAEIERRQRAGRTLNRGETKPIMELT